MNIFFLALDGMLATSLTLPLEMTNAARQMLQAARYRGALPAIHVAGVNEQPVTTAGGVTLLPESVCANGKQADTIFIPTLWRNPYRQPPPSATLISWLRRQADGGAKICATGTGVFLLARTGLLNGRHATTHWYYCDLLQKRYPAIKVQRQHLITQSGALYCAGSVNSVADLTVHLIGLSLGYRLARQVENQFSPEVRRRYGEKFYSFETDTPHPDEAVVLVQQWLQHNRHKQIGMEAVAKQFSMSQRTLNRRFRRATGMTPLTWLARSRTDQACDLLTHTNLTLWRWLSRQAFRIPVISAGFSTS